MKHNIKKIYRIEMLMNPSEAVIFTKGGLHHIKIPLEKRENLNLFDEIMVTVQLEDVQKFNFVTKSFTAPKESLAPENVLDTSEEEENQKENQEKNETDETIQPSV